jgi:hypothetical protein
MRNHDYCLAVICGLVLASAIGCPFNRKNNLDSQVAHYNQYYKWKDYATASQYVADPEDFLKKTEQLGDKLEIVEYEIVRATIKKGGKDAEVEIMRTYHIFPSVVIERQRIVQQWKYNPKKRNWFLISPY